MSSNAQQDLLINKRLSVVIVAMNEDRTIDTVLNAVGTIADEIVFVDSGSTDRTIDIAKSHGVKFYHQDWLGYAAQKNFALSLASGDWLLSLDADEVLSPQLVLEIKDVLANNSIDGCVGFKIPRMLHIGNTAIAHGGFYPDAQLRLIRKGAGSFNDRLVHERIFVEGKVGCLKSPMLHYAYANVDEFAKAMDKYARLSAQQARRSTVSPWSMSLLNQWAHPLWTFFMRYVLKAGFLDGMLGLKLNLIYCDYVRRKITYLRQALN